MSWNNRELKLPASVTQAHDLSWLLLKQLPTQLPRLTRLKDKINWPQSPNKPLAEQLDTLRQQLNKYTTQGQEITVHPWQHTVGKKENSGCYLSPANAIQRLSEKLLDSADPHTPNQNIDAVAIMAYSTDFDDFINKLDNICYFFATPNMLQIKRLATSHNDLAVQKMQTSNTILNPYWPQKGCLLPNKQRLLRTQNITEMAMATSINSKNPFTELTIQLAQRQQYQQQLENSWQQITQAKNDWLQLTMSSRLFSFYATGSPSYIANALKQNLPTDENIYTACTLFIGDNLSFLKEMLT